MAVGSDCSHRFLRREADIAQMQTCELSSLVWGESWRGAKPFASDRPSAALSDSRNVIISASDFPMHIFFLRKA